MGYAIQAHVDDAVDPDTGKPATAYVSTTEVFEVAEGFAMGKYVYTIHATENMVDVAQTMGPSYYSGKSEIVVLGGIHWNQIKGWTHVGNTDYKDREFIQNDEYDSAYDGHAASPGQPQLAGFPVDSPMWQEKSWKACSPSHGKTAKDYAEEFMEKNGKAVGWDGRFPLFISPQEVQRAGQIAKTTEVAVKAVVEAAQDAFTALGEATRARDFEAARREALKASLAAAKAEDVVTGKIVPALRGHPTHDAALFFEAFERTLQARRSANEARIVADEKSTQHYKKQIQSAKEEATKKSGPHIEKLAVESKAALLRGRELAHDMEKILGKKQADLTVLRRLIKSTHDFEGSISLAKGALELFSRKKRLRVMILVEESIQEEADLIERRLPGLRRVTDKARLDCAHVQHLAALYRAAVKEEQEREAKKKKQAKERAKRSAEKMEAESASGTWLGNAVAGVGATITTVAASYFLTDLSATTAAAAGGSGAGLELGGLAILGGIRAAELASEEATALLSEAIEKCVIEAIESAPVPLLGPVVAGRDAKAPGQLGKRAVAEGGAGDEAAAREQRIWQTQVAQGILWRAFGEGVKQGVRQAREVMHQVI